MADLLRLQALFDDLLEIPEPEARRAALEALDVSAEQRRLLIEMLNADDDAELAPAVSVRPPGERLPQLLGALAAGSDPQGRIGERLGPYLLVEVVGQGGMGAVYRAERVDGEVHQQLAIKLITQPDPAGALVARIESERRLLASLEHPGIARFLDAGRDAGGQPWLAMEYVEGRPLLEFAQARGLALAARIKLCIDVCDAVAYAHGRLVVHRDLKSSNVLVSADGQPRLLDFGIARSLDSDALEQTRTAERFLSPLSAAPEQLRGEAATIAIDIYALGVLLYQLLAARPPLELTGLPPTELQRQILVVPPLLLSVAAAASTDADARARAPQLRGDLEQIVARCLRKRPEERYRTVAELADDLGRFLRQEPVRARAPSLGYRTLRFVQRHRWPVLAASIVFLVLLSLSIGLWRQGERLIEERDAQIRARARADRISAFLVGLFTQSSPRKTEGTALSARELLDRGLPGLLHAPQPGDAALLLAIAGAYADLGEYDAAEAAWHRASGLSESDGLELEQRIEQLRTGAEISGGQGHYAEALAMVSRAEQLALSEAAPTGRLLDLALARAELEFANGQVKAALATLQEARKRYAGSADLPLATLISLDLAEGRLLAVTGDPSTGLVLAERGLAARRGMLAPGDPALADTLVLVARAASYLNDHVRMRSAYEEARDIYQRAFGNEHLLYAQTINGLGVLELEQGRLDEAQRLLELALSIRSAQLGPEHPSLAASLNNLALLLRQKGEFEVALQHIVRAEAIVAKSLPEGHFTRDMFAAERGLILIGLGHHAEAAALLWRTRLSMIRSNVPQPRNIARTELALAELCSKLKDAQAVRRLLGSAGPVLRSSYPSDDPHVLRLLALEHRWSADQPARPAAHSFCDEPAL